MLFMSLSNISQVLSRNLASLSAKTPLFINLPEDGFIAEYKKQYPQSKIRCYNTYFIDYLDVKNKYGIEVSGEFNALFTSDLTHDTVIIHFPKSKAELNFTLAMLAPYLGSDAKIFFVGEKKGGVQSTPKLAKSFLTNIQKLDAARHCLLYVGLLNQAKKNTTFKLDEWYKTYQISIEGVTLNVASLPGVFSQQKLDVGTSLLLHNLPDTMQGRILDFGCGAGVISCFIGLKYHDNEINLELLDVSALALASAKKSLSLNNLTANIFASDSLSRVNKTYQHIVSNPPFHQGTKTNYKATEDFLAGIKKHMARQGDISIVANSFLQYPKIIKSSLGNVQTVAKQQGFSIYFSKA
jgi:16S rRNA (guanine1207-N2)-methyltransferase